jgi:hypothetical protein
MAPPTRRSYLRTLVCASLACSVLTLAGVSVAEACGGFFRARTVAPEKQPSLSREKVLLIHDAEAGQQHFIREVAFARATEPFGFVVPTPTRPSVEAVKHTPFTKLRNMYPFEQSRLAGGGARSGKGAIGDGGSGVSVLEVKTVGSFTAFVLAATDAEALAKWLRDNELVSTEQADAWLAHYVDMGFYYVAMRYDPPKGKDAPPPDGRVNAETMRISFATPVPYYPYLEPELAPNMKLGLDPRLMELWYVGSEEVVPVAVQEHEGKLRWVRPLHEGQVYEEARGSLELILEPELRELLPEKVPLVLQTFQDQKLSREGFQDILFAAKQARELTPERRAALEPLLGVLDPALVSGGDKPGPEPDTEADTEADTEKEEAR